MICRPSRERLKQTHFGDRDRRSLQGGTREQNALGGEQKKAKNDASFRRPTSKKQKLLPCFARSGRLAAEQTEYSWVLWKKKKEKLLVVQNPLVRPPLREEQKRYMGKCLYCPHGSSSTAASSRVSERTPDPFPYQGGLRTRTHRLGAHGGKK